MSKRLTKKELIESAKVKIPLLSETEILLKARCPDCKDKGAKQGNVKLKRDTNGDYICENECGHRCSADCTFVFQK